MLVGESRAGVKGFVSRRGDVERAVEPLDGRRSSVGVSGDATKL